VDDLVASEALRPEDAQAMTGHMHQVRLPSDEPHPIGPGQGRALDDADEGWP
jgi:hypothetical protein